VVLCVVIVGLFCAGPCLGPHGVRGGALRFLMLKAPLCLCRSGRISRGGPEGLWSCARSLARYAPHTFPHRGTLLTKKYFPLSTNVGPQAWT